MDKQRKLEETLKIISLFRERELLWNTNDSAYRRKDLKKKALAEIGRKCNMTEEYVKKKLKSLRSTYIIEKKKVEQSKKSGCDVKNVYEPSLYWYGEMSFLDNLITTRKSKDRAFDSTLNESNYVDDNVDDNVDGYMDDYTDDNVDDNMDDNVDNNVDDTTTSNAFDSDISCTRSTAWKRKREDDVNTDPLFDAAIAKIVNMSKPTIDAFSTFAESMAMTLRTMPEETAYLTMKDIQELLYQRKFNKEVTAEKTEFEKRRNPRTKIEWRREP